MYLIKFLFALDDKQEALHIVLEDTAKIEVVDLR